RRPCGSVSRDQTTAAQPVATCPAAGTLRAVPNESRPRPAGPHCCRSEPRDLIMRAVLKGQTETVATRRGFERSTLHELDDGRLVLEHLRGDPQAFGALVDRSQTRLLALLHRTIGDRERAEDLVQEVFIRV